MTWIERTDRRLKRSKTFQDNENQDKFSLDVMLSDLHYENEIDSGVFDTAIDATPIRVDNPNFDGWRITESGWHYALGKDLDTHGDQDGWVGFGGRQGQNWIKFRLARVGYHHWPTRAWDDIGGAPDYKRQNLSHQTNEIEFTTNGSTQPIASVANWADIWITPVGGSLSVLWAVNGNRLKEEITINQAGREWITANRPPITPLNETYFGFVFQLDWSDIPKIYRQGILQDIEGDFADDGESIELKDALDKLLAFLPISDVRVPNDDPLLEEYQPLRKRFYKDTDGKYYLLLGVRADILNAMPAGDLIFDPTIEYDVGASTDDAFENKNTGYMELAYNYILVGDYGDPSICGLRFVGVTIPDGVTIDTAYLELYAYASDSDDLESDWYAEDGAAPGTFTTTTSDISDRTSTTATVPWDNPESWTINTWYNSPELKTIVQELEDSYDYSSGSSMVFINYLDSGTGERLFDSYDNPVSGEPAKLHIEYTSGDLTISETDGLTVGESTSPAMSDMVVDIGLDEAAYQGTGVRVLTP